LDLAVVGKDCDGLKLDRVGVGDLNRQEIEFTGDFEGHLK